MRVRQRGGSSLLIVAILLVGALFYLWLYHPSVLESPVQPTSAPAAKSAAPKPGGDSKAKEDRWQAVYRPHPVCGREKTELERLECLSDREEQRTRFEAQWRSTAAR